jgi:hypothetical protein
MSTYLAPPRPPRVEERTPDDWLDILLAQLRVQSAAAEVYEAYYDGRHPLQFATSKFREAFGTLFGAFADNWCQIVVDAPVERLKIVGFAKAGSASDDAWSIWQDNALDTESVIAHTEAGKCGESFLLVDPNDGEPKITVEHSGQMVVITDPGDRRKRLAALKRWLGDDGYINVNLYLPDLVIKYESSMPAVVGNDGGKVTPDNVEWEAIDAINHSLGVVPVIPLENKPGLMSGGHSDLEPAIPLQNAVNKICTDMIVASEYGAFRQRALTGVDLPKDPHTGEVNPAVQLKATMSRLWNFEEDTARIWDLNPTDLSNYVHSIELLIQHMAAQTRTPPHYLLGQVINASGDALIAAEAGLTTKCRAKILFFSDAWEEAMALALGAAGTDTEQADLEAIWDNPERVPPGVIVDACVKKKTLGVPLPILWREMGYTPEQIAEMEKLEQQKAEEQLALAAAYEAATTRMTLAGQPPEPGQETTPPTTPPPKPGGPTPPPTPPPPPPRPSTTGG